MKKKETVFLSIIILISIFSSFNLFFNTVESAPLTIRVGAYENNPKIFTDDNGNWVGFWPDIVNYIADQEGWTIEWVEGTWSECLTRLENEEIDFMVDVAYTPERALLYDFNNISIFSNWGILYSHEVGAILSFSDLENKTIAVMNNSIHYTGEFGIKNLTQLFGINCSFVVGDNYYDVFEHLDNHTADVGAVNRLFGLLNKDDYDVMPTSLIFNPVDLKFAFPQNGTLNDQLIERIDYHVEILQNDPDSIYYQSIEQYFLQQAIIEKIPDWIIFLIISIVMVVLIFLFMSVYLKRKVDEKTLELRENNKELELLNQILIETIPNGVLFLHDTGEISIINQNFKNMYYFTYDSEIKPSENIFNLPDNLLTNPIKNEIETFKKDSLLEKSEIKKQTISLESSIHIDLFSTVLSLKGISGGHGFLFVINDVTPFIDLENMRKQFISTVSHELRTPITAINLSLNNLFKYRENLSDEQRATILDMMRKSGEVLSDMIEDLLITSRIDATKLQLEYSDCNIDEILGEIIQQVSVRITEKELHLKYDVAKGIRLQGDLKRISQIFRILIDNAIKYTPKGSEIEIQVINGYKGPNNPKNLPGVLVKVIDTGIGIPKKDLPKLFDRFHRGSNVDNIGGTGLGLSIAKALIERHSGELNFKSKQDEGTTFFVFLPLNNNRR